MKQGTWGQEKKMSRSKLMERQRRESDREGVAAAETVKTHKGHTERERESAQKRWKKRKEEGRAERKQEKNTESNNETASKGDKQT